MSHPTIQRVDPSLIEHSDAPAGIQPTQSRGVPASHVVRWFVIPLSIILSIVQATLSVYSTNSVGFIMTCTLVAMIALCMMFLLVLILNPLLRLIHVGRWMSDHARLKLEHSQDWAGKLAISAVVALAAVTGPGFMLPVFGTAMLTLLITSVVSMMLKARHAKAVGVARHSIAWMICLTAMAGLTWVLAGPLDDALPWPGVAVAAGLHAIVSLVYLAMWILTTHALTRAEVMTVMASLVVVSGISTYGLTDQFVPLITTPWNAEWNTPQSGWDKSLHPNLNENLYITDAAAIVVYREGLATTRDGQPIASPSGSLTGIEAFNAGVARYWQIATNMPWEIWLKPLAYWMIFILGCYGLFYALTYTVVDYWANREKLIFPLAQLHMALLPDEDSRRWFPAICRSTGFWVSTSLVAIILSYNTMARLGWLGDMGAVPLGMNHWMFQLVAQGTFLEGISGTGGSGMRFAFIFTAIGIAFMLPLEISFSIWFYYLLSRAFMLALVAVGHGMTTADFPSDWLYRQNEVTAQGGGALLVFSCIVFYRALKDRSSQIFSSSKTMTGRWSAALPPAALVVFMTVVTLWIWWSWKWNLYYLFWALLFVLFITIVTLGLTRITAEGGVYWFQSHASFFHFWKAFALGKFLPGTLLTPLLPIYSVLFMDIKTFMAPNLINGAKMQNEVAGSRVIYHLNMVLTIVLSVVISVGVALVMAYAHGAQRMHSWFYSSAPKSTMSTAMQASTATPEFNGWIAGWIVGGGLWIIVTTIARQTIFWFPHPIGYVMLMNPMIHTLWLSFFVGWVCKKMVINYGGKNTYDKARGIFLGLIIGEILAIFGWSFVVLYTGRFDPAMTLNNTF